MKYKLVCFDMDGVIFKDVNFWLELHKAFGTFEDGKELTKKYLHSDYNKLVEVVMKLWKGRDAKPYFDLVNSLEYVPGAPRVIEEARRRGYMTAIISASSIEAARRVQHEHSIDHIFANELVIRNGKISGEFIWPMGAGKEKKAEIVRNLASALGIKTKEVIYVGDSDTDIEAFKVVGLSIAFNSTSTELRESATHIVDSNNLEDVLRYIP